jgi:hypothetical protein
VCTSIFLGDIIIRPRLYHTFSFESIAFIILANLCCYITSEATNPNNQLMISFYVNGSFSGIGVILLAVCSAIKTNRELSTLRILVYIFSEIFFGEALYFVANGILAL